MDVDSEDQNDTEHEYEPKTPKPHEFLWFPDGNIVLATDTHLFKVHKSVLSLHSSVFKDMFDLPGAYGSTAGRSSAGVVPDLYEKLPVVTLAGDDGEDVAHLLRTVYERR